MDDSSRVQILWFARIEWIMILPVVFHLLSSHSTAGFRPHRANPYNLFTAYFIILNPRDPYDSSASSSKKITTEEIGIGNIEGYRRTLLF